MNKNNKGFMLAEVIITSTIVMTAMVSLYFTFNKIYNKYKTLMTYQNVDGMYAIEEITDNLFKDEDAYNFNRVIQKIDNDNKFYIIQNNTCKELSGQSLEKCQPVLNAFGIETMVIIKENETQLNEVSDNTTNQPFKKYLEYLKKYYKINKGEGYYLIILEYKNNNKYNYSSMELGNNKQGSDF